MFAGAEEGVGVVAEELVVDGFAGLCDGVAVGLGAVAPAVEDGENNWFRHLDQDNKIRLRDGCFAGCARSVCSVTAPRFIRPKEQKRPGDVHRVSRSYEPS